MCRECRSNPHLPGCPEAPEGEPVRCPVCGKPMETVKFINGRVAGCNWCVEEMDANDWELLGCPGL